LWVRAHAALTLASLCLLAPPAAAQTITYTSQERRVEAYVQERYLIGDPPVQKILEDRKSDEAPGFGAFNATVRAQPTDASLATGFSTVSQHSSLGSSGVNLSGTWSGEAASLDGYYEFSTLTQANFRVADEPARFDLAYRIDRPDVLPGSRQTDFYLRRVDGGTPPFEINPVYRQVGNRFTAIGSRTGVLEPGPYTFRFYDLIQNDPSTSGGYEITLLLSPVPEPGGIAVALLCAGLAALRRHRRTIPAETTPSPTGMN
jgi:hypothetical protein